MGRGTAKRRGPKREATVKKIEWRKLLHWSLALTLFAAIGAGGLWLVEILRDPGVLPLKLVRIDGQFRHLDRRQIERAVGREIRGNFFTVDVGRVQRAALALPWVDRASVRRVWPQTLVMQVEEQVPLARWGDKRLVNPRGEIFAPAKNLLPEGMARLQGPDSSSIEVVARYLALKPKLALLGLGIAGLELDARGAWQLVFSNGLLLHLGSEDIASRIGRFVTYYPRVQQQAGEENRLLEMDLRYTNGFTVRWQQDLTELKNEQKRTAIGMQSAQGRGQV